MLHLLRIPVAPEDAQHLVDALIADGSPHARSAAALIQKGLDRELYAVPLKTRERDALLAVLDDPPAGLMELRAALTRDHHLRTHGKRRL